METHIAQRVAEVLKAAAHPIRLQILEALEKGECCVGDVAEKTGHPQSSISQHLGLMKDKGILACRRDKTKAFYSIQNKTIVHLLHCIYDHCDSASE